MPRRTYGKMDDNGVRARSPTSWEPTYVNPRPRMTTKIATPILLGFLSNL